MENPEIPPQYLDPKPKKPRKPRGHATAIKKPARKLIEQPTKRKPEPEKMVSIALSVRHSVNGLKYGPGVVTIPESLARSLAENEERNIAEERALFGQGRAALIAPGGRSIPVPKEYFDDPEAFAHLPASITQSGRQLS